MIEVSHFNPGEAYAAIDRHRLDDQTPYLYRTRDYGETWQMITNGIAAPSFLRAIREDPNCKGLLFAGTEFGIYVSFDDGDHWQSLQLNLPVTSVQDIVIHGDDLAVATHGRSFWILDDITPLRQANEVVKAEANFLYRPAGAVRVDNDGFLGSPLPPEEPTAENPPNGAVIDYFLKSAAVQVKLEIIDGSGNLVRSFSSDDKSERKRPPTPIADRWFPKPQVVEKTPGMHRFVWNLAWGAPAGTEADTGDSEYGSARPPRAVPGNYTVRLTVDGKTSAQPLKISMDPRSAATAEKLERQLNLGLQIFGESQQCRKAQVEINSVKKQLSDLQSKLSQHDDLKAGAAEAVRELQNILSGGAGARMGLEKANTGLTSALRVVESGDRTVPAQALEVYREASEAMKLGVGEWDEFQKSRLAELNRQLRRANLAPISITASP